MPASLGNPEKATLIALMLVDGEVSTPELKKQHGVELRKDPREKLNKAGLIASNTDGSPHLHKITPAGLATCEEVLVAMELPPHTPALLRVVFELLAPVVGYLQEHDIRLVDVIRPTAAASVPTPTGDLESLIRAVYHDLSVKPQDWVRLAKLRPKLNGAEKDEVDQTLLTMAKTGLVHLAPDSNRKVLTDADHAAAIRIGSENKHLMAIEES